MIWLGSPEFSLQFIGLILLASSDKMVSSPDRGMVKQATKKVQLVL